jgi:probable phosphoglycerate mutase
MPEATRLVLIRHGQTDWNAELRLQGQRDVALNALGRRQAERLADALVGEGLSVVVSSDLDRALKTAQALAVPLGLPLVTDAGLRERGFGVLEGYTFGEIEQRWPDQAARWRARDEHFAPDGGESLRDFYERCVGTVEQLAVRHAGHSIAIVCHGGVLDCLYRAAARIELGASRTWLLGNASINRLLHTAQGLVLVGWNDDAHLDGLERDASD